MELGLIIQDNKIVVSSRKVAENYGKRHDAVLRDIRGIIGMVPEAAHNFVEGSYPDQQGQQRPEFVMDRQGFSILVMGFTGEQAKQFTYKYTTAFEQMAAKLATPVIPSPAQALLQAVTLLAEQEKKVQILEHRVNTLDGITIEGTKRQQLNAMIRKYAFDNGFTFSKAWQDFIAAFNLAYRTNLTLRVKNTKAKSTPDYLERVGWLEDALRVADKLLNTVNSA